MREESGLSRRDVLKRGAVLGGSLIWAVPTIQAIGMSAAFANETSPVCNVYFAAKIGQEDDGPVVCVSIHNQGAGPGKCLDVAEIASDNGFTVSDGACDRVESFSSPDEDNWTVTLAEGCQLWDAAVGIKTGGGNECVPAPNWSYDSTTRTITFDRPDQAISHVEFIFCCSS